MMFPGKLVENVGNNFLYENFSQKFLKPLFAYQGYDLIIEKYYQKNSVSKTSTLNMNTMISSNDFF